MRATLLLFFVLFAALTAAAQTPATITGYVLESSSGRPIANAEIVLFAENALTVKSAQDGSFTLPNIRPGVYSMNVLKGGYIPEEFRFGKRRVRLEENERREIIMRMQGSGTLSGRVIDSNGRPSIGANVRIFHFEYQDLQREPSGVDFVAQRTTDDRGEYRLFDVLTGHYFVIADGKDGSASLYPGEREFRRAQTIEVRADEEVRLRELVLPTPTTGTIRIHVQNATGAPLIPNVANRIAVLPAGWAPGSGGENLFGEPTLTVAGADRAVRPVLFGSYVLYAAFQTSAGNVAGFASVEYSGGNVDVDFVLAKLEGQIPGRVLLEKPDGSTQPLAGAEIEFYGMSTESSFSAKDGTFAIKGLLNGPFRYTGSFEMPEGYYVSSIREKESDRDLFKEPLQVSQRTSEVEVKVRADGGSLSGKIIDSHDRLVPDGTVALVPQSLLEIRSDRHNTFRIEETGETGSFELKNIIPGEYLIYAWANASQEAVMDPQFLERYKGKGLLVKVDPSGKLKMDVRILDE